MRYFTCQTWDRVLRIGNNITAVWYQVSISGQRLTDPCFSTVSKKQGQTFSDQFQQVFLTLVRRVTESYSHTSA